MTFLPTGGLGSLAQAMGGGAGINAGLQAASPLLLAMSAGMRSGDGAMSQMPMGLLMMQQQQKLKQEREAKSLAASAYGSWQGGTMASGTPAAMGASNTPPPPTGPLAGAMANPGQFSSAPSMARGMDEVFAQTEQQYRLPAGYLARTAQIESGGNPNAQNPNSSAGGLFQFIDSTAAQYGVNKMDPASATEGAARLAADNASYLRQELGREPSAGELYLAHQQGAGGAAKLLLNPNAKAADIVGTEAVRLNGGDPATWTAGDFARRWQGEYGETQIADPASDPQVQQMLAFLAQHGDAAPPGMVESAKMQLQMRIQRLQAQSEGQGLTDAQAAQFGLQEAGQQGAGDSYTLRPGEVRYGPNNQPVAAGGPDTQDPMSTIGKLKADLDAGRITPDMFNAEAQRLANEGNFAVTSDGKGGFSLTMGGAAAQGPLSEMQAKQNTYLTALEHASPILDQYEGALTGISAVGNEIAGMVPFGEFAQSPEYQQAMQAVAEWGAPVLRLESGAALTSPDYKWLTDRYIPVAGDKDPVVAQKRNARRAAEAGVRSGMSDAQVAKVADAIKSLRPGLTKEQSNAIAHETAAYPGAPKIGASVEGRRYAGGDPNVQASWVK